jgi:hypothetical protein
MAPHADCDQIFLGIVPGLAARLFVVDVEVGHRSARLASPTVAAEHLVAKLVVQFRVQAQVRLLLSDTIHEAFSVARCRKSFRSSSGRNLNNRRIEYKSTSELAASRLAPAQEISADHLQAISS